MKEYFKKYTTLYIILSIIFITFLITFFLTSNYYKNKINNIEKETITKIDTVYNNIIYKDTIPLIKKVIVKETVIDTLYVYTGDTIKVLLPVEIPIANKHYYNKFVDKNDTITYNAYISGYRTSLDSININVKYPHIYKETIIKETYKQKGTWNYNIGIGAGYGIFNKKPDIFIGTTFGYTF